MKKSTEKKRERKVKAWAIINENSNLMYDDDCKLSIFTDKIFAKEYNEDEMFDKTKIIPITLSYETN